MVLSDEMKNELRDEYENWKKEQYADKTIKERQDLGAYFTPPELTLKMLEKLDIKKNDTLLDPCLGAGGLLAAAIIMKKVKPENCYGIELDADILKIAQKRLSKLGVPLANLHHGNALNSQCYEFKDGYKYDAENDVVTTMQFSKSCSRFGQLRAKN